MTWVLATKQRAMRGTSVILFFFCWIGGEPKGVEGDVVRPWWSR